MQDRAIETKYLRLADAVIGISNKHVLEVGGSTPPDLLVRFSPGSWVCADMNTEAVARFNNHVTALGLKNLSAAVKDITTLDDAEQYDLLYSVNCFEHVHDLNMAFGKMFHALNHGGYLFTVFGPIWSSDVGHHLSILTDEGALNFQDGVLSPWEHLTSTPDTIKSRLKVLYGSKVAEKAVDYIFTYHDLNRLMEDDYLAIVNNSGFSPVLILRKRKGTPPDVAGATSTREFLMILKKGRVTLLEKALCALKFGWAYIRRS